MVLVLLIPLVFIVVGGFLVYLGFQVSKKLQRADSWPVTPVVVKQLEVKEDSDRSYDAVVQYEYSVEGAAYLGISTITCES